MKKVKILTIVLAIIFIIMVSFFGIYTQKQNRMENQIKDYNFTMDLGVTRTIGLSVNEETKEVIKDAEGKEVSDAEDLTDEEITEKGYTKEEVPYNSEEVKNLENYKKTKKIIEERLHIIGVDNYIIKQNEQNGDIVLEVPENNQIDGVLEVVNTVGEFKIIDSNTNEVVLNNDNIKNASVTSQQTTAGTTIYLQLELNEEGTKKVEEIKSSIVNSEETTENTTNESATNTTAETENSETDENQETENKWKATLDDQNVTEVSFTEETNSEKLRIAIGNESTSTDILNQNANNAAYVAFMINTGNLPVNYTMGENQYIVSDITSNQLQIALYIIIGIIAIATIILIIKHKTAGILGAIAYIGFIASFLIVIRYTNVILSIEGLLSIVILSILNYVLTIKILKEPYSLDVYKKFFIKIMPIIILAVTFCFVNWAPISSFGMVSFWGIVLMAVYNIIVTSNLIKIKEGEEK